MGSKHDTMAPWAAAAVSLPSSVLSCCLRPSAQRKAGGVFHCCSLSLLCWQRPRVLVYIGRSQHSSRMNLALGTPWRADSDDCTWKLQAGLLFNSPGCSIFNYFFYFNFNFFCKNYFHVHWKNFTAGMFWSYYGNGEVIVFTYTGSYPRGSQVLSELSLICRSTDGSWWCLPSTWEKEHIEIVGDVLDGMWQIHYRTKDRSIAIPSSKCSRQKSGLWPEFIFCCQLLWITLRCDNISFCPRCILKLQNTRWNSELWLSGLHSCRE